MGEKGAAPHRRCSLHRPIPGLLGPFRGIFWLKSVEGTSFRGIFWVKPVLGTSKGNDKEPENGRLRRFRLAVN